MKFTRAFLKSITWRLVAIFITGTIAFVLTGSYVLAAGITGLDSAIKIFAYVGHEWLWERKKS